MNFKGAPAALAVLIFIVGYQQIDAFSNRIIKYCLSFKASVYFDTKS